ncbi:MAG: hypothetical protein IPH08_10930 [Rhodocyclaceae bacterium]|nr:hypothetical protein [Rhodocyclaceae bacterium]
MRVICHVCGGYAVHEHCDPYAIKEDLTAMELKGDPVPRCPGCGSLLRPDIVLFGEPLDIDILDRAMEIADSGNFSAPALTFPIGQGVWEDSAGNAGSQFWMLMVSTLNFLARMRKTP